jgi:hypothetical protein
MMMRKSNCKAQSQLWVLERVADVWHNVVLVDTDGENLSLTVNAKNSRRFVMRSRDENGLGARIGKRFNAYLKKPSTPQSAYLIRFM